MKPYISMRPIEKFHDEMTAFMLGLDDAIERVIIRYLYENKGWISFQDIKEFTIDQSMICMNQSTLSRRLTSLVKFDIIERRVEHDNKTYYRISQSFIKELQDKCGECF